MKLPTRRALFWASVAVFAVLAPLVAGYALGYRFDFTRGGVVRTGALLVETEPGGAAVHIDGTFVKHTGAILSATALVRDLAPRSHRVRIEKSGYRSWEKEIEIQPAIVTEIRHVRLWPIAPITEELGELTSAGVEVVPGSVQFSPDGTHLVWETGRAPGERSWFVRRLSNDTTVPIVLPERASTEEARVRWSSDSRFLVVEVGASWWRLDRDRLAIPVALPSIPAPRTLITADSALAVDTSGILSTYQFAPSSTQAISRTPVIPVPAPGDELIAPDAEHVALRTREGTLRIFDPDEKAFTGISGGVVEANFSPDGTQLLWRTNRELWVRTAGTNELITRFADSIEDAIWEARGAYILFSVGGTLKTIELDRRSGRMTTDLASLAASQLALDQDKTSVLAVRGGTLMRTRFP